MQRIGIARHFILIRSTILDEATSALDTKTEEKLVKSIAIKNKNLTVIAISHRLSTLKLRGDWQSENNKITERINCKIHINF